MRVRNLLLLLIIGCATCSPAVPQSTAQPYQPTIVGTPTDIPAPVTSSPPPSPAGSSLVLTTGNATDLTRLAVFSEQTSPMIFDVSWHPDGTALLLDTSTGLALIDTSTWEITWTVSSSYAEVAFSPQGDQLIALSGNDVIRLDPVHDTVLSTTEISLAGGLSTITPGGGWVAETLGGDIHLWDSSSGEPFQVLETDASSGAVLDMAFSADGSWAVAGSDNGDLQAWDIRSGQRLLYRPAAVPSLVYQCEVQGNIAGQIPGSLLVICSYPSADYISTFYQVDILRAATPSVTSMRIHDAANQGYGNFAINADATRLAVNSGGTIEIWNTAAGSRSRTLEGVTGTHFGFNPRQPRQIAIWSDHTIQIWDVFSGALIGEWVSEAPTAAPVQVAFSPQDHSRLLAVLRDDNALELWNLATMELIAWWQDDTLGTVAAMAFSPNGTFLALASHTGQIIIFESLAPLVPRQTINADFPLSDIAFSPLSNQVYAVGDSTSVHVWNLATSNQIATWKAGSEYLRYLAVRGNTLSVASNYGFVATWSGSREAEPKKLYTGIASGPPLLEISPDETQVLLIRGSVLQVYDLSSLEEVRHWEVDSLPQPAFSPDGCLLAWTQPHALTLLDINQGMPALELRSTEWISTNPTFSSDGLLLVFGLENGTLTIWGLEGGLEASPGPVAVRQCGAFKPLPTPMATLPPTATPMRTPTLTPTPPAWVRTLTLADPPMNGDDVLILQQRLLDLGYDEIGRADGIYGLRTDTAVRRFQERNGLDVDGYVGPRTWEALFHSDAVKG